MTGCKIKAPAGALILYFFAFPPMGFGAEPEPLHLEMLLGPMLNGTLSD